MAGRWGPAQRPNQRAEPHWRACAPALQGLGETLALYWASAGAKLILSSRSMDKLQARSYQSGCYVSATAWFAACFGHSFHCA